MALIGFLNQRHNSYCYLTTAPTKLQHSGLCKSEFLKYWQIKKISSRGWSHTFPLQPLKVWGRLAQPYTSLLETHNRIQCVYTSKARCARLWIKFYKGHSSGQLKQVSGRFRPKISACFCFGISVFSSFGRNTIFGRNSLFWPCFGLINLDRQHISVKKNNGRNWFFQPK